MIKGQRTFLFAGINISVHERITLTKRELKAYNKLNDGKHPRGMRKLQEQLIKDRWDELTKYTDLGVHFEHIGFQDPDALYVINVGER